MDAYLELQLLPDPEFPPAMLMNALFAKLHRALVSHGEGRIGISFPDVGTGQLGQRLRLHGQAGELEKLMASNWLQGMRDHLAAFAIHPVPDGAKHRIVRRVQAQSNPERLRRRLCKRHTLSEEEARQRIPNRTARYLELPYVQLRRPSTGQHSCGRTNSTAINTRNATASL